PEFTSLCPKTGQPDFGHIVINYIPDIRMVESKSLKLYLFSFRNHGDFHEDCINIIMKDLISLMSPRYIEVTGLFTPRGGISIRPFACWADENHQDLLRARLTARMAQAIDSK
ncbi:MAG: preQ(1) synthase, partial [Muribaculaceae bacterium]|nr:preQ(1) synthase [Muribaculaceae bacterium]